MQAYTTPQSQGVSVSNGYRPQSEAEPILSPEVFVAEPSENDSIKKFRKNVDIISDKLILARIKFPIGDISRNHFWSCTRSGSRGRNG